MQMTEKGTRNCVYSVLSVLTAHRRANNTRHESRPVEPCCVLLLTSVVDNQILLFIDSQRTTVTNERFENQG